MKTTFSIRLIASDHLFYDGPCTGVIIPALDGQREVLAHHESVIMADCDCRKRVRTSISRTSLCACRYSRTSGRD